MSWTDCDELLVPQDHLHARFTWIACIARKGVGMDVGDEEEKISYLNFAAQLTSAVVGDSLGPDTKGRYYRIADVVARLDGKPGTRVKVWRLTAPGLTITDGAS